MTLYGELQLREKTGNPIKVGVIGAGQMGRGMIAQIASIPGMIVTGISDLSLDYAQKAKEAYLVRQKLKMMSLFQQMLKKLFTLIGMK